MTSMITMYPDELSFDEFDNINWDTEKQFGLNDNRRNHEIALDVLSYATQTKGQIYTQVDGDEDRLYSKGMRTVNRTGIWWVVSKKNWTVDNRW